MQKLRAIGTGIVGIVVVVGVVQRVDWPAIAVNRHAEDLGDHTSEEDRPLRRDERSFSEESSRLASRRRVAAETLALIEGERRLRAARQQLRDLSRTSNLEERLRIDEQIHFHAALTLDHARRLERETGNLTLAANEYRRVRDQFAGTRWSEAADAALAALGSSH